MKTTRKQIFFLRRAVLNLLFEMYRKTPKTEEILKKKIESEENESSFRRIRCPHCRWQPNASSRWFCSDCGFPEFFYNGCLTSWNTFDTRGQCPGCSHVWTWTSCLRCGDWAKHEDWYEDDGDNL